MPFFEFTVALTQLYCVECGSACTSVVPEGTVLRAYLLCPECLERIPHEIADAFLRAAEKAGMERVNERLARESASPVPLGNRPHA